MLENNMMDDAPHDRRILLWARPWGYPYLTDVKDRCWVAALWREPEEAGELEWLVADNDSYSIYATAPLFWRDLPPSPEAAP